MLPSGSLPVPENETDWPAVMVTFDVGLVIVPVGGTSAGAGVNSTNCASEGTLALFSKKTM